MSNFPTQIKAKTELQEKTTEINFSHVHLTTSNFGDYGVALYRNTTPREKNDIDVSVFARPFPIQTPVMAAAKHQLKLFFVPYRTISPQWNAFINKSPYVPYNGSSVIQVAEMPYFTTADLYALIIDSAISSVVTLGRFDYKINSTNYRLTAFGRYVVKTLHQLGYDIIFDSKGTTHIDAKALLAYCKVFCDFYYNSAYYNATADFIEIEKLFKKDGTTAYHLNKNDILNIMLFCQKVFYDQSIVVSAWDNPMSPNTWADTAQITLQDISLYDAGGLETDSLYITNGDGTTAYPTTRIADAANGQNLDKQTKPLTQYAIDALKKMNDYCVRFAMAGNREVDRYLARFGVLLSAEKMKRCIFYGEQITDMEFGAVYSTASTTGANVGDYAGQSIINSDGKEHKHWEIESDEYGIIIGIATIIPKVNYFQGIDRNNLTHEVETYFSGIFDQLGTQGISQAEVLVSNSDADGLLQGDAVINANYGWLPRGYQYKIPRDFLTGDFRHESLYLQMSPWHLFRKLNPSDYATNGIIHSIDITRMLDSGQYARIFDNTNEEDGDHFHVIYQIKHMVRMHAKALYDNYDFESEGKEIMLQGNGPKQN